MVDSVIQSIWTGLLPVKGVELVMNSRVVLLVKFVLFCIRFAVNIYIYSYDIVTD